LLKVRKRLFSIGIVFWSRKRTSLSKTKIGGSS